MLLASSATQPTYMPSFLLYFFLLYCCWLMCVVRAEMHCLVIRPGFGLVSELCPPHTVACRIRIEKDAVSFYEYSPLYDRNQFVCVLKGEFGVQVGSGCVRKRSGHIRCWCYGRSNCNSPENSKLLYGTFLAGDEAKFLDTIHQLDFEELREKEEAWNQNGNTFSTNGATRATTEITKIVQKLTISTPTPTLIPISSKATKGLQNAPFSPPSPPRQSAAKIVNSSEPLPLGKKEVGRAIPTQLPPVNEAEINYGQRIGQKNMTAKGHNSSQIKMQGNKGKAAANQQNMAAKLHSHIPIERGNISSSSSPNDGTTNNAINGSSMRSEYDRHNRVHVIHVSARDRYEPVNLFGSTALQRIMEKERKLLQSVDEFGNSSTRDDAEGEEEEEELEEDWEWPIQMGMEEEEAEEKEDNHQSKQFQQPKRMAESGGPKQQKNKPNHSVHKIRLEQRQRSPSASKETEEELEEGENAIGQEYFDNTFIGPSSSSSYAIFPSSSSFIFSISFIILHLQIFVFFTLG